MAKVVHGVGINDVKGSSRSRLYQVWWNMLERCYSRERYPTYLGCSVCEEWKRLSNFIRWAQQRYQPSLQLDKDIIIPGNKIYSPETCCFVPDKLNSLLIDSRANRGQWPVGVDFDKRKNKFRAQININGSRKHLGYFNDPAEAQQAYALAKSGHIMEIANQQQDSRIRDGLHRHAMRLIGSFVPVRIAA